jgi:UDP-N-acetylmuramoyl-L-alanyl-D-glutamate--2,6-diaminopimelate ligase
MTIREILKNVDLLDIDGPINIKVTGIAYDARRVTAGNLFFAMERGMEDGHTQIELAIERGAVGVVCRRNGSIRQGATKIDVADTRKALAQAAFKFYGGAAGELQIVGVTGASGQWNIAFLLKEILEKAGVATGLISTVRHEIGERQLPASRLFPQPSEVQGMLRQMVDAGCGACVIEIPAEELEESKFIGMPFDVFVFAGAAAKRQENVLKWLGAHSGQKSVCSVINIDEHSGRELCNDAQLDVRLTYGTDEEAEVHARNLQLSSNDTRFVLEIPGHTFPCRVPLVGRHNVRHLLAAVASGICLDISPEKLRAVLKQIKNPPGNLEVISRTPAVYVDEARTPETLELVLNSLSETGSGRLLLVMGCDERSDHQKRFAMGGVAARCATHIVLTSDNPGREPVEQICSAMAEGIEAAGRGAYHFQPDRALAIREVVTMAQEGDIVLIAGKGERAYQEFASTIVPFDDREHARECLEHLVVSGFSKKLLTTY